MNSWLTTAQTDKKAIDECIRNGIMTIVFPARIILYDEYTGCCHAHGIYELVVMETYVKMKNGKWFAISEVPEPYHL